MTGDSDSTTDGDTPLELLTLPASTLSRVSQPAVRDAVKQGRKDKLGLFMITQNPEDIDSDILKQNNTNIFLGLREEVITKVPSIPRGYEQDLQQYGKGQAAIKAPDVEAVEVTGLPYCLTQHSN